MGMIAGSFVSTLLLAKHEPPYGIDPGRWRWRRLTGSLSDPYRPELHYMRGPGPKWREKHGHGNWMAPRGSSSEWRAIARIQSFVKGSAPDLSQ